MAIFSITKEEHNDWVKEGNILFPCNGKVSITSNIIPGIWKIVPSPNPMDLRLGIVYQGKNFDLGLDKIYDVGGTEIIEIIKKTWNSKIFRKSNKNLCCIFNGLKGTGKTISAKLLCNHYSNSLPVIIVNNDYDGKAVDLIQSIDFECVVLIDEAEKTFDKDRRIDLLKICDGVYSNSSKIILLTMNNLDIDKNLIDRPGRVRYIKNFGNLPEQTCKEYIRDSLKEEEDQKKIFNFVNSLGITTVDILKNIIDEFSIHGDLDLIKNYMNLPIVKSVFPAVIFPEIRTDKDYEDIREAMSPVLDGEVDFYDWWNGGLSASDLSHNEPNSISFRKKYRCEYYEISMNSGKITPGTTIDGFGKALTEPDDGGFFWMEYFPAERDNIYGNDGDLCGSGIGPRGNILSPGDKYLCKTIEDIYIRSRYRKEF